MDTFIAEIESYIRGHHVYQREWTPVLGEELHCQRESTNANDPYAVAVRKDDNVVGHVPSLYQRHVRSLFRKEEASFVLFELRGVIQLTFPKADWKYLVL